MKHIKRIITLCLSLMMIFSLIIASGVTTASALPGAGLQQTSFRSYGADISFWNVDTSSGNDYSLVDFAKMKADGCDYVILRIGYEGSKTRQNTMDTAFLEYYKRARAAGMPLGVYFYQLGITYESAVEDAQWVIDVIEDNNMYFEYPIYYDVEDMGALGDNPVGLGNAGMEQLCLGWCETLAAAGYFPGIYGGGWSVLDKLSDDFKSKYDLWYAAYPNAQNPHLTTDKSGYCGMWQYAASGYNFDGVPANASLDVNVCYKDYPAIMKQYGYNNCGESEAKSALRAEIAKADALKHYPFSDSQLETVRAAYKNAVSVLGNTSSNDTAYTNAKNTLYNAVTNKANTLSVGKNYTVSSNPRTDKWADDGKRLTDGVRGSLPGDSEAYAGLGTAAIDITVDLGTGAGTHNNYGVFAAVNTGWGIAPPAEIKVSVSNDGSKFTEVATTSTAYAVTQSGVWTTYFLNAHAEYSFAERYVRFSITPNAGHIWLDEVAVSNSDDTIRNAVYINGINQKIEAGDCHVFTPDFGEITTTTANHTWTRNVIVKWDNNTQLYLVESITSGYGAETPSITLSTGELLIAAHSWEGEGVEGQVYGSKANHGLLSSLKVGDPVSFSGVDVASGKLLTASYMSIINYNGEGDVADPPAPIADNLALNKGYVTSDIYAPEGTTLYPDENGVTLTDGKNAASNGTFSDTAFVGFNVNSEDYKTNGYSYITVDLGKAYSVDKFVANVASMYNSGAGIYAPSEISVYVSADNASWTKAGSVTPVDTDTVSTVAATIELDKSISARYVQFRIVVANGKSWMFVSELEVYEGEPETQPDPVYLVGDVNDDKKVDSIDYLLVKRSCFNTYTLSDEESVRANVNADGNINSVDYILIKRMVFGTYTA